VSTLSCVSFQKEISAVPDKSSFIFMEKEEEEAMEGLILIDHNQRVCVLLF